MTAHRLPYRPTHMFASRSSRRAAIGAAGALGASLLAGVPALAQDATPAAGETVGLGIWAEQLATLDPADIARLLLEREPTPHVHHAPLVTRDVTADLTIPGDAPFPVDRIVSVVALVVEVPGSDEIEEGTGMFVVFESVDAAAQALDALPVPGDGGAVVPTSVAGLPGVWGIWGETSNELALLAGPVMMLVTDELMADGASTHLAVTVGNVLLNADHVLHHLYAATDEALGID